MWKAEQFFSLDFILIESSTVLSSSMQILSANTKKKFA